MRYVVEKEGFWICIGLANDKVSWFKLKKGMGWIHPPPLRHLTRSNENVRYIPSPFFAKTSLSPYCVITRGRIVACEVFSAASLPFNVVFLSRSLFVFHIFPRYSPIIKCTDRIVFKLRRRWQSINVNVSDNSIAKRDDVDLFNQTLLRARVPNTKQIDLPLLISVCI